MRKGRVKLERERKRRGVIQCVYVANACEWELVPAFVIIFNFFGRGV